MLIHTLKGQFDRLQGSLVVGHDALAAGSLLVTMQEAHSSQKLATSYVGTIGHFVLLLPPPI